MIHSLSEFVLEPTRGNCFGSDSTRYPLLLTISTLLSEQSERPHVTTNDKMIPRNNHLIMLLNALQLSVFRLAKPQLSHVDNLNCMPCRKVVPPTMSSSTVLPSP